MPGDNIAQKGIVIGNQRRLEGGLRLGVVGEWSRHCPECVI